MENKWTVETNQQLFNRALAAINDALTIIGEPRIDALPKGPEGPVDLAFASVGQITDPIHFECFEEEDAAKMAAVWDVNRKGNVVVLIPVLRRLDFFFHRGRYPELAE